MDLAGLLTYLRTLGDPLPLDATDQQLPAPLRDFLGSVPGQRLTVSPGQSGLHLDGSTLTISGTATATWPVTGLGDAAITLASAEVQCTAADAVTATASGLLPVSSAVTAPVTVTATVVTGLDGSTARGWRAGLAADLAGVTPVDLLALGQAGAGPAVPEPPGLTALTQQLLVPAAGFGLTFYPNTSFEPVLAFEVDAAHMSWTIVENIVAITGMGLSATVVSDSWSLGVVGHLTVGGVAMDLTVSLADASFWTATLKPASGAFPGLAALAAWIGGGSLASGTSQGLTSIGFSESALDAAISLVSVQFDWATQSLRQAQVVTLLTIGALQLDVALVFPSVVITGCLHDGKAVPVAGILSSLSLPTDGVPAGMQVIEANFSAMPSNGSYHADLTVDLDLSAGPLTIDTVHVGIGYTALDGFTGQLGGTIWFGSGILIDLMAEYGGATTGWEFTGCTDPGTVLRIGDLLADLATAFGVSAVPEPVKQLTLSDVLLDYQTGTGAFSFSCAGALSVGDVTVEATVTITIKPSGGGHETTFGGTVTVAGLEFALVFDEQDTGAEIFVASYRHTGQAATVSLHDLVAGVSASAAGLVPGELDIGLTEVRLLALRPAGGPAGFGFSLVLSAAVDLSQLPLIGDKLPPQEAIAVDGLQVCYTSGALTAASLTTLGGLLPPGSTPLPAGPLAAGVSVTASLAAGGPPQAAALSLPPPAAPPAPGGPPAPAGPAGYWRDVHRQLGVVQINRIGLLYQAGALLVGFDAAITLGPLSLSLDGLCFGSPLSEFSPRFQLSGLGLAYASGPLTISGALLRVPDAQLAPGVAFQFDGTVQMSAQDLELAAIGSYAQFTDGQPSLFVFAQLKAALGGPPAFFVDGLMAGFGFNRQLARPGPAEVSGFPLVALGVPSGPGAPPAAQNPSHVLDILEGRAPLTPNGATRAWVSPSPGAIWLAVGVEFTSFELLRTRAMLVADVGAEFKLAVLGVSILRLPQQADSADTYAYVELGIEAVLVPEEGYFGLTAILSPNSYVISPACRLTGGFAVAAWFGSNPHAGEFVVTLGGYHPAFAVPGHFPVVPRLGFRWAVSGSVTISGSAYAALTTSCVMAGGQLDVVFQDGGLRAWFSVAADLLVSWRPFFFTGHFAVSIGVSYTFSFWFIHKTISVSVGATMDLWGPPTGGTVSVSLWVVSFTVAFGAGRSAGSAAPLDWPGFRDLLPAPASAVVIQPAGQVQASVPGGQGDPAWVVRATGFSFRTQSALPVSDLRVTPPPSVAGARAAVASPHDQAVRPIDIKPMNLTGVTSAHTLTVRFGSPAADPLDLSGWTLAPRTAALPDSLWGPPPVPFSQVPARPAANVLPGQQVGYDVATPPPALGPTRGTVPGSSLASDVIARADLPVSGHAAPGRYQQVADPGTVAAIAGIAGLSGPRGLLHDQLVAAAAFTGPDGPLDRLAAQAGQLYSDAPLREEVTA